MADNDILFPKCKFSFGSVSPSPHHFMLGSVSTFKYDDVSMLKTCWTFICDDLSALKVHKDLCKFSIGSIFQIFHWFSFPNFSLVLFSPSPHPRLSLNIIAWLHSKHLCVVVFPHYSQNRLTHLYVAHGKMLR